MENQTEPTNEVMTESERHGTISLEAITLSNEIEDRLYDIINAEWEDRYVGLVHKAREILEELGDLAAENAYRAARREENR
jgi:hypothetical protein